MHFLMHIKWALIKRLRDPVLHVLALGAIFWRRG